MSDTRWKGAPAGMGYGFAFNDHPASYKVTPPHPASLFTPQSLAARAVR